MAHRRAKTLWLSANFFITLPWEYEMTENRLSRYNAGIYLLLSLAALFTFPAQEGSSARERDTKIVQSGSGGECDMSGDIDQEPAAQTTDPVYLNHFFLVLDAETYKEIKESKFLQEEFATFEHRTTVRTDITYTGIYFYGTHTYFEFFEPGGYGRAEGAGGIASGVEAPGAGDRVKRQLEIYTKAPAWNNPVTRRVGEKDLPWFHMIRVAHKDSTARLSTWLMEYHEEFLNNWYPELSPKSRGITREEVLERYVAKLGDREKRKGKYLDDVVEITLALAENEKELFIKEREAFGYKITGDEKRTVCEGPGIRYAIIAAANSPGAIASIKMSLRRDKKGQRVYRFGSRSVLQFNDDRAATWSF
jgi:Family of unknown function (DUF5829)